MSPERYEHLKFDLWMAFNAVKTSDWFTAQLFRLFHKADPGNRHRLGKGFPDEATVYEDWDNAPNEDDFFGPDLLARGRSERAKAARE